MADGSGRAILDGDPFATVVMLANAPPDETRGLLAGDIVTTGSCTGAPLVPGEGAYRAEFGRLGSVEFAFAPLSARHRFSRSAASPARKRLALST